MSKMSDVERGANWAKWLGIVKMGVGVFLLWLMSSSEVPFSKITGFTGLDALFEVGIGVVSLYLGLKLLNPMNRKSSQFTTLIVIYSVIFTLDIFTKMSMAASNSRFTGPIIPFVTAWALWRFVKGRKELKSIEEGTTEI